MALAPICPKCGGNGHEGHTFVASEWTAQDAARHGFDPERTSQAVFRCQGCGHWFPMMHWRKEKPGTVIWALHREDGAAHEPVDLSSTGWWVPPGPRIAGRTR